ARRLRARAVLVNRTRHQFLPRSALSRNQYTARLWCNRLNEIENRPHVRALTDDVVESGQSTDLAPQISGFLLPFQAIRDFTNRPPKLLDEFMILDDKPVRARIDRRDC